MVATNRLTPKRPEIDPPTPPPATVPVPPPATPADLSAVWSNAVFAAVAALQRQLTDDDPEVVREAAGAILDLEKTRLRHGREVAGVSPECGPHTPCAAPSDPHTACADHTPEDVDPAERAIIEKLQKQLQAIEDQRGSGKVVSFAEADAVARRTVEAIRRGEPPRTP